MLIRLTLTAAAIMLAQQTLANDGPLALFHHYANNYQHGIDIFDYWKSEKLDGIRAIWTGNNWSLVTVTYCCPRLVYRVVTLLFTRR